MNDAAAKKRLVELAELVGPAHVVTDPQVMENHLVEPRGLYRGRALAMIRPGSTEEIARLLRYCNETRLAVVPQGGNTGLVGGQIPDETAGEIVLSLQRMNKVREVDPLSNVMIVEANSTSSGTRCSMSSVL